MSKVKLRRKEKTPFAGYSGSCCQVKVDESPDKGVLIWEWNVALEKHTPRFVGLKNDYGVKTFEIEDLTCKVTRNGIKAYNKDSKEVKVICFTTDIYCFDNEDR